MVLTIRDFRETDWESICAVHDAARPIELKDSCDPRAFVPLDKDPEAEELRASIILVAEVAGEVVGFSAVDGGYIGWLYVHPEFHRQGIGRSLLRAAVDLVESEAWTIVLDGNVPAIELYTDEGFRVTSQFRSDNEGYPVTCLRMMRFVKSGV